MVAAENCKYSLSQELRLASGINLDCQLMAPPAKRKNVGSAAATYVRTGEKACITVAPQLCRFAPLVDQSLPTCAAQVTKDMLNSLPVSLPRVRVEAVETADSGCDVWAGAHSQVHEGADCTAVGDEGHPVDFLLGLRGICSTKLVA